MRPSKVRTISVIAGLSIAVVLGLTFKEKVIPPTPLLFFAAGADQRVGPPENFTGRVTVDTPFAANAGSGISGARVKFEAGARTNWHSHPKGQLLVVTEGRGWVQDKGGAKRELKPGDTVWTAPDVSHWHGATPFGSMTHIAVSEPGLRGTVVAWGEPVDAATYEAALDAGGGPAQADPAKADQSASDQSVASDPAAGRSK